MPCATLLVCYMFTANMGAFVGCVSARYSTAWIYVLLRCYASMLDLDTQVTYGLCSLNVSVGHTLYFLCAVFHMLVGWCCAWSR